MLIKGCFVLFFMLVTLARAVADCNPAIPRTTPDEAFSLHDNGTVTHKTTGLMWMRCMLGQTWYGDGALCSGPAQGYSWQNALQAAEGYFFAGYNDWRLPNKNELASIVEEACFRPAINTLVFPNTPASFVWTSSPFVYNNSDPAAWYVYFVWGYVYPYSMTNPSHVRLVRGGQ